MRFSLFVYVLTLQEIKNLNKEKINKEELLIEKINKANSRMVKVQQLTSEVRITKLAKDNIGLVKKGNEFDKISVDLYKAEQIEKLVNDKYE